jgi:hypothetical protein
VATALRERREIEGIRPSDRRNLESMQRVYIQPLLGKRPIDAVRQSDVERLGRRMLAQQLAPKTVRNLMTVLSSVFALAIDDGGSRAIPSTRAARRKRRRHRDSDPDMQLSGAHG